MRLRGKGEGLNGAGRTDLGQAATQGCVTNLTVEGLGTSRLARWEAKKKRQDRRGCWNILHTNKHTERRERRTWWRPDDALFALGGFPGLTPAGSRTL